MFNNKKILVTGSRGMIGQELVLQLNEMGAEVYQADLSLGHDLREFKTCREFCFGMDYVFHLAGIKGSPKRTSERPVDFMGPMLQFDTNMILAAQDSGVKRFMYTSSIAVEHPEEDKYPAWAKQTAEHLCDAIKIQNIGGTRYCIVRPANVYGRFDNTKTEFPMVITALIKKAIACKEEFEVWGDGNQVRDFINAKDVARGMIKALIDMPKEPVNLCSGKGITIKMLAEIIAKATNKKTFYNTAKPRGADSRVMKLNWDFKPEIEIFDGIEEVICQFSS